MRSLFIFIVIALLPPIFAQINQGEPSSQQQNLPGQISNAGVFHQGNPQQGQNLNPHIQGSAPVQDLNQIPNQQVPQQADFVQMQQQNNGVPPIQQAPPQPFNSVPPAQQLPNINIQQPNAVPQQAQQFNLPPVQSQPLNSQTLAANFQQQQTVRVPMHQQVPLAPEQVPTSQQQVPQVPPVPQQFPHIPPGQNQPPTLDSVQPDSPPPHKHNEGIKKSYDEHFHNSLPPKPRQKKFEPPSVLNDDRELDFYSRLPSPADFELEANQSSFFKPYLFIAVYVTPGAKDCYFYEASMSFVVGVQVIGSEDRMDIGLVVFDPSGLPIVKRDPSSDVSVTIAVQPHYRDRAYGICLDNRKASFGRKKVYLSIEMNIDWKNPSPEEEKFIEKMVAHSKIRSDSKNFTAMFDNIEQVLKYLNRISGSLQATQRLQQRSKNFLAADRNMMMGNLNRVTSWSTFQAITLILIAIFQTLLIRSLFDENSHFHKLWIRFGSSRRLTTSYNHPGLRY